MLSRKPRTETGKNIYRTPSQISLLRACGRLLRVSTTLQIPTHLMKPCHTTVAPSRTQKLKLTSLRRVSKLQMTKDDRQLNRLLKKSLENPIVDDQSCFPIKMAELLSAIQKMKRKGAAGPDNTPSSFFKSLGSLSFQEHLFIFNSSFHRADCSQIWIINIIPLLKASKSPSKVASFRPINLPSCVVKLLEQAIMIDFITSLQF